VEAVTLNQVAKKHRVSGLDSDLQRRLGAAVRARRHELGITQEELAWRADLHRTYVADVERGARNVTLWTIASLARALHVTAGNLLSNTTAPFDMAMGNSAGSVPNEMREILLVDHSSIVADTMARAFERAKLTNPIKIVHDGATGLDYLFGTGRYAKRKPARPQLILLVLDPPKASGQEFLLRVWSDERTRDIPVVSLTISHPSRCR
jgi:transcriptional regulator with XRE-family HTH domain